MATKTMNVRVSGKRDTLANWTSNNPVLLSGEVGQVIMTDGTLRHKTGNGTNTFTQLSYDDEIAAMPKWFSDAYDTDKDGIVDNAEKLGGQLPSYYAKTSDVPNVPAWALSSTKPSYTAQEVGAAAMEHTHEQADITGLSAALAGKVNAESGKGLSTNDYTTAEKQKLAGIAAGANNYTHPSTHPASMITGLATVATSGNYNDLSGKPVIPVITSGTEELTPGISPLADGVVYLQYE